MQRRRLAVNIAWRFQRDQRFLMPLVITGDAEQPWSDRRREKLGAGALFSALPTALRDRLKRQRLKRRFAG
ncbi:hypothetical protein D3C86_2134940 [compost metagenome]